MLELPSEHDYRYNAPPRAFGSETEFTADTPLGHFVNYRMYPDIAQVAFSLANGSGDSTLALANGGEIMLEAGALLEYASPECRTPRELALYERAGEHIVTHIVEVLGRSTDKKPRLFKRTGYAAINDANGEPLLEPMSTGHHENYSTTALNLDNHCISLTQELAKSGTTHEHYPRKFHELASYLATRPIWAGAGMVDTDSYSLSQKRHKINFGRYGAKLKDGLKTPFQFHENRLEIRSGDGNMSQWAVEMKYGLSSLVIRLVEHGKFPEDLVLADATDAADSVAGDPYALINTKSGLSMTALEHQSRIIDAAYEAFAPHDLIHPYEEAAVEMFEQFKRDFASSSLQDNDVRALADRVDWATKLHMMFERGLMYQSIHGGNIEAVAKDLRYEEITGRQLSRSVQRKLGQVTHTNGAIQAAILTPPPTRAGRRVETIRAHVNAGTYRYSVWDKVIDSSKEKHLLGGPL